MNTIAKTNFPAPVNIDASLSKAPPDGQAQARPQMAAPVAPDLPSRKPSVIAIDTSGVSTASVREAAQPIEKVVQAAANAIQEFIQSQGGSLSISVDGVTGYHVIRVTDNNGNEVMSLPSDAAIRIAHNMQSLQGLLVNQNA
jgi:flagellar protein FlaG